MTAEHEKERVESQLLAILEHLWSFTCQDGGAADCKCDDVCGRTLCPCTERVAKLRHFLQSRQLLLSAPTNFRHTSRVLSTIKEQQDITRQQISSVIGNDERSLVFAVELMVMTDCSTRAYDSPRLEGGAFRRPWGERVPFSEFMHNLYPYTTHDILSYPDNDKYADFRSALKATVLKKRLGLIIRPTDDLRDHLRFDRRNNVLEVFHHAAFLKEQLALTKALPKDCNAGDCVRL